MGADDPDYPPDGAASPARGRCGRCGDNLCPCCCHPRHRCCCCGGPCTVTKVLLCGGPCGCLGCCVWTLIALPVLWAALSWGVLKPIMCGMMETELWPEAAWLDSIRDKTPQDWTFVGSQADKCTEWMAGIDVEDWRFGASDYQEVFFESSDGLRLQGVFIPGKNGVATGLGPPEQAPTIIQVHGHGPYVFQQSQMIPAKGLSEQGFNVFAFNNQGLCMSEAPPSEYATRAFGADEITNTLGAITLVTEDPDGLLSFTTPISRVGLYVESGGNGMVLFFRSAIPGLVMHASIFDWFDRFQQSATEVSPFLGMWPMVSTLLMQCASDNAQRGGIIEENYADQLDKCTSSTCPSAEGRKVMMMYNKADTYNVFDDNAVTWEASLEGAGFDLTTDFSDESAEEGCNGHVTELYGPDRKQHFQRMCTFWESVFGVNASCDTVLSFEE